jgi:hypothetical protein
LKVLAVGSGGVGDCTLTTDRKQKYINRCVVVFNCEAIVSFTSVPLSFLKIIADDSLLGTSGHLAAFAP